MNKEPDQPHDLPKPDSDAKKTDSTDFFNCWQRMEGCSSMLLTAIEREACSRDWRQSLSEDDRALPYRTPAHDVAFFVAASKGTYSAKEQAIASEALDAWQEFRRMNLSPLEGRISSAISILQQHIASVEESYNNDFIDQQSTSAALIDVDEWEMLNTVMTPGWKASDCSSGFDLEPALALGRQIYNLFKSLTPMSLMNCYCPVVDAQNCETYYTEARYAVAAFRLSRLYNVASEGGSMSFIEETISMHEALRQAIRDAHR